MIKKRLVILFLLFLNFLTNFVFAKTDTLLVTLNYRNTSFSSVINDLEEQTPFQFYYIEKDIPHKTITYSIGPVKYQLAFDKIFKAYGLNYIILQGDRVILTPERENLKPFSLQLNSHSAPDLTNGTDQLTETEKRYRKGLNIGSVLTIKIGKAGLENSSKKAFVQGRITNSDTGEPLAGVSLQVQNSFSGAISDFNGFAVLPLSTGTHKVKITSVGFEPVDCIFEVYGNGDFTINLTPKIVSLKEFKVSGESNSLLNRTTTGMENIKTETIRDMPILMGERDVIKSAQLLPGVVTVGEGSAGINVRGGGSDQNMFIFNGLPIYNTSHLFGFFSAFNSDVLESFTLYKGNIPAEYGGRLSSVFEVKARESNRKTFKAHGGISPVSAFLTAETPVIKNKSAVIVSARSTWSDFLLKQVKEPNIRDSRAGFSDLVLSYNHDLSKKDQLRVFSYYSNDNISLSKINDYNYTTMGGTLKWDRRIKRSLKMTNELVLLKYHSSNASMADEISAYRHSWDIDQKDIKSKLQWITSQGHVIETGIMGSLYKLNRGEVVPFGTESLKRGFQLPVERSLESAIYASAKWNLNEKITLYTGFRYSFYQMFGERDVYTYPIGAPPSDDFINDTLHFDRNKVIASYSNPEPRIAVNYKTGEFSSLKLSYNRSSQYFFMLSNTIAISPADQWKLSDYHIKPLTGNQISLGYYKTIPWYGIEASLEIYSKENHNVPEYIDGADFTENSAIEQVTRSGTNKAYGLEFMLKKSGGRFNGWLNYTYSRSFMKVDGEQTWQQINNGISYPSNYDRPHVFNLASSYKLNRRFNFSGNFVYYSGRPVTLPRDLWYMDGIALINYSSRNEYRIPDYVRTDISIAIDGNLKREKFIHSSWLLSVYNLWGRNNIYSIFFKNENGAMKGYTYSVIGVPIFTVSWIFKLGNYAN